MNKPTVYVESLPPREVPESGAKVTQLTSTAYIHSHIYPEAPIFTPDSRYFIYNRLQSLDGPNGYWLCDAQTHQLRRLTEPEETKVTGPVMAPNGEWMAYLHLRTPTEFALKRVDLCTQERHTITVLSGYRRPYPLGSISPDGRWYLTGVWLPDGEFGIVRIDLQEGTHKVIHQDPEILNPHMQFEPGAGQDILVQYNRGGQLDAAGNIVRLVGDQGATFYIIDVEGQNRRDLAIGKPYSAPVQGHQCWIGNTGRVLSTLSRIAEDNLVSIGVGDEKPTVVATGAYFWHPNASRDGRWFVSDVYPTGEIMVGSIKTGRYRLLCCSESSCGRPQYTHPHPFFSPDSRTVYFNSDRTGLGQIYMADVPEGLLEELEA